MQTDVVVVGGGPVGENVADYVVRSGLEATIVESELVGGECSYWACMPSKALLNPARAQAAAKRVPAGPETCGPLDPVEVLRSRDEFASHWRDDAQVRWLDETGISLVRGRGRVAGERLVVVTDTAGESKTLEATTAVVLAVGSKGTFPPIDGMDEVRPWGSREITSARAVPRRLAVLGGGAVGCEMAQAWRRLGALEVTLVERRPRLLPDEEPFVGEILGSAFTDEGIDVEAGVEMDQVRRIGSEVELRFGGKVATVDELVVATGRRLALDDVGLDTVGIDPDSLELDAQLRVSEVAGGWLYVVGDAAGRALLTHQGKYEARIVAEVITGATDGSPWATDLGPPRVVFTDPEVAAAGLTETDARDRGLDVVAVAHDLGETAGGALRGGHHRSSAAGHRSRSRCGGGDDDGRTGGR